MDADDSRAPALRLQGVHRRFGGIRVLQGVDLQVGVGELVALVGENGVGKSTLVRCVAGTLPADAGVIEVMGTRVRAPATRPPVGLEVVWQDLALCDNLDVVDNLFLGRERMWTGSPAAAQVRALDLLDELGVDVGDLRRPVADLSGGQRQSVALARTLITRPALLVLDEPTGSLDSAGIGAVERLIAGAQVHGTAILLVSHDLELVSRVADRALVLRNGVIVEDLSRPGLTADRLQAAVAGLAGDTQARQQLHALTSLVDQLAEVEPSAVLPLIVSAVGVALEQPRLALHLLDGDGTTLRLAAGLALNGALREAVTTLDATGNSPLADAVRTRAACATPDLRGHPDTVTAALPALGCRSVWSVPLVAGHEVLGTLSGLAPTLGSVTDGALELAMLYGSHAAAALERERFVASVTRRNESLETIRRVLQTLAGPVEDDAGLTVAMEALRAGLGAAGLVLLRTGGDRRTEPGPLVVDVRPDADAGWVLALGPAEDAGSGFAGVRRHLLPATHGAGEVLSAALDDDRVLLARWSPGTPPDVGAGGLLVDGARSMLLALQRRASEQARQETVALRRSRDLQRTFLSRLSHELRTPLTAIHGYADTLRQPDVSWDDHTSMGFLDTIVRESSRLGTLVTDLLDASAIEAGVLRLQLDWCDLSLVVQAAAACMPAGHPSPIRIALDPHLPPIRGDHDRLQQVLVNLIGNAVSHTPSDTTIAVTVDPIDAAHVAVVVTDDGPGLPATVRDALFVAGVRGGTSTGGAGLGLSITHGIVHAHGGTISVDSGPEGTAFTIVLPVDGPSEGTPGWSILPADGAAPTRSAAT